jgi:echinoderm microtubule-associated protein-like 1/2
MSKKPASQQCRAVASSGNLTVYGMNDGSVICDEKNEDGEITRKWERHDAKEWISVIKTFGENIFIVGSHDNNIYMYDNLGNPNGVCKGHTSFITAIDIAEDGSYLRSNSGDYELLFWDNMGKQDPSGRSNTQDTVWKTQSALMAWHCEGIYPPGADGTYVNSVTASPDGSFLATGDDSSLWRVFNYPARPGHKARCYRGHASFVQNVVWDREN